MAYPRVFISSTCYDLREIRDVLFSFIDEMNYIPVLSDKGDVFYHPDIHTHDSCLNEIETCQLFILIIGGRFGGKYKADPSKSIVNAEYDCARKINVPIITFISREVYEDHRVYVRNRKENKSLFKTIVYPSIDTQNFAINIFEFIDDVRKSEYNNAIFPFEFGREIRKHLKQQWAGMFYEFLRFRQTSRQIEKTNKLLSDLTVISEKTEEILNMVYKSVDKKNANNEIAKIDKMYDAKRFFMKINNIFENFKIKPSEQIKYIDFDTNFTLKEYLVNTGKFHIIEDSYGEQGRHFNSFIYNNNIGNGWFMFSGDLIEEDQELLDILEKSYESFKNLSITERQKTVELFSNETYK